MTRSYFLDYVTDWYELIELCREYDCDICEDIIDSDELDDYVDSDISNTDYGWRSIRDSLADIPTGYDFYRCDGTFDYAGLDDGDFEDYKSRVLDWMDEDALWDAEEDEEEEDEDFDPNYDFFSPGEPEDEPIEPAEPPVEEDFSVSELMCMCSAELVTIRQVVRGQIRSAICLLGSQQPKEMALVQAQQPASVPSNDEEGVCRMRWLINYIRSLFCKHEWEHVAKVTNYSDWPPRDIPIGYTEVFRCKKCGYVQKIHY